MRSAWIDLTTYIESTRDGPSKTGSVTIGNEGGHADVQLEKILYQEHPGNLSDECVDGPPLAHCAEPPAVCAHWVSRDLVVFWLLPLCLIHQAQCE